MAAVKLYVGFDEREEVGSHVFLSSLLKNSSVPVTVGHLTRQSITKAAGLPVLEGTNAFTLSRFLIPFLEDWRGWAIFMDGADMLIRGDISELASHFDPWKAVQVVKHDYKTKHPRKYLGTQMESANENYPRKQWASVMLINCSHYAWRKITPQYMSTASKLEMLQFRFLDDSAIGEIPKEWNWLADEDGPNDEAKLLHWTAGIPGLPHYKDAPHSEEWRKALEHVNYATN